MEISDKHSINRVKRAMANAERHRGTVRAARLYIACRKWLGTWGPSPCRSRFSNFCTNKAIAPNTVCRECSKTAEIYS